MSENSTFIVSMNDFEKELFVVADEEQSPVLPQALPQQGTEVPVQEESKDWRESKNVEHFLDFLSKELKRIGKPIEWRTETEKERGLGQLKRLNRYISEALRQDYDGRLDAQQLDKARGMIEHHIGTCELALDGLNMMKKQRKTRHADEETDGEIVKEANTPSFRGLQVVISPFERAIVGSLINGVVAGGRNMEELFEKASKKYKFNPREELSILQILCDMGYPIFKDRLNIDGNSDPTREKDLGEWSSEYYA